MTALKIYPDTDTIPANIRRHADEPKSRRELAAMEKLLANDGLSFLGSRAVLRELEKTKHELRRKKLADEHKALPPLPKDEKVVGFNAQSDQYGGFIGFFLISDVQDESLRDELIKHSLEPRDAEHIAQAVSNGCDVFLTRDKGIIKHRAWLEARFPKLKIRRPTELLEEIAARSASG